MDALKKFFAKFKTKTFGIISLTVIAVIALTLLTGEFFHATGSDQFCGSCHEMSPFIKTYQADVHGGNNPQGFKAECVHCHLPQNSITAYSAIKIRNGIKEFAVHSVGAYSNESFLEDRVHREKFVYESGCILCHSNVTSPDKPASKNPKAAEMHAHYESLRNTTQEVNCVSCHVTVGHKGLIRQELITDLEHYPFKGSSGK